MLLSAVGLNTDKTDVRMAAKSYAYCEPPGFLSNIQRTKYLSSEAPTRGPGTPVRVLSSGVAARGPGTPARVIERPGISSSPATSEEDTCPCEQDSCCSTCFVCCQDIREATHDAEGESALWCEGRHKQWAHARCAGVSEDLYQALQNSSTPWACPSCTCEALEVYQSLPQLQKAVCLLQSTVTALQLEVNQLKESAASNPTTLPPGDMVSASNYQRSKVVKKGKSKGKTGEVIVNGAGSSTRVTPDHNKGTSIPKATNPRGSTIPKTKVVGARKTWGTLKTTTSAAVAHTIKSLTKVTPSNNLVIKRKFKTSLNDHKRVTKWWFVIRGNEEVLERLHREWNPIAVQTAWKLEPVLSYSDLSNPLPDPLELSVAGEARSEIDPGADEASSENVQDNVSPNNANNRPFLGEQ